MVDLESPIILPIEEGRDNMRMEEVEEEVVEPKAQIGDVVRLVGQAYRKVKLD